MLSNRVKSVALFLYALASLETSCPALNKKPPAMPVVERKLKRTKIAERNYTLLLTNYNYSRTVVSAMEWYYHSQGQFSLHLNPIQRCPKVWEGKKPIMMC